MGYQNIIVGKERGIFTITLNRPKVRNALNLSALSELCRAMDAADNDPEIKVLLVTGAGRKAFCSGRDLSEYASSISKPIEDWALRMSEGGLNLHFIEKLKKPIIAVINGYALGGGCELALACDFRMCSDHAKFGLPEIDLDAFPGIGGTWLLPKIVGKSQAMRMILTGEWIDAQEAVRIGLVDRVVPYNLLMAEAKTLAKKIADKNLWAIQLAKLVIQQSHGPDFESGRMMSVALRSLAETLWDPKERVLRFQAKMESQKK